MPRAPSKRSAGRGAANRLRIIGGVWRGRRLQFPDAEGLRPSPDRVRETLFNWLAPVITGARCLDLFAGSGALGLEALSRGAGAVVLVDRHHAVIEALRAHAQALGARQARLVEADAMNFLAGPAEVFDIVFLDPPFHQGLLAPCCRALEEHGWLAPRAHVYLEAEQTLGVPAVPDNWMVVRSKRAGEVGYHLAQRRA